MALKQAMDGAKTAGEIARKAYEGGFGRGFGEGAKWVGKQIGPVAVKLIKAVKEDGTPNKIVRSAGSALFHICKKIKHL